MILTVGQKVWLNPLNNAYRRNPEPREVIVTKVGKKYFEVNLPRDNKFYIDTMIQVSLYSADYKAYSSLQEILDDLERVSMTKQIIDVLSRTSMNFNLKTIREVSKILGIPQIQRSNDVQL